MRAAADSREFGWLDEAALAEAWAAGPRQPLRLEDGRDLRVIFPGVGGGAAGPDFRGAMLEAGGDLLRGDVELHLRVSGWRAHRHHLDMAYKGVVLHVAAANDSGALVTLHGGRAIPILVLRAGGRGAFPPPFTPPCAFEAARGADPAAALARLGLRRLRIKAARVQPLVAASGPGQALYTLLLETLGGPANRGPFAALARRLPLGALLGRAAETAAARALAMTAELKGAAASLALRRAGMRPMASPGRRLEAAGGLFASLWPVADGDDWPLRLAAERLLPVLRGPTIGRALALELAVNAILPVALASGRWPEQAVIDCYSALPSPGTYGRLKPLQGWLAGPAAKRPFGGARALQGGLLLHAGYCTKGACGRCPLSDGG